MKKNDFNIEIGFADLHMGNTLYSHQEISDAVCGIAPLPSYTSEKNIESACRKLAAESVAK